MSFIVPVFGGRPVFIMIASQAISTIVVPLLIVLLLIMLNSAKTVGDYKNPVALNLGLIVTLCFALLVSYSGALGLFDNIRDILFTPHA